ncbi:hypothetical protein MPER_11669 [Moniliophthora perniciosa FA553]|nr:hypothetical protein MPER_11669 [Moniliophthora perniciosa FA553]
MDIDRPEKMARSSATPRSQPTPPSSSGSSSNSATPPQQPFRFGLASTFAFNPEPVTPVAGESEVAVKLSNAQRGLTQEDVNEIMSTLAKHGFTGFTVDDLEKLNPTDEYEIEIQVMAEVRGYFQVAYKRVIDNVPGFIDLQFLKGLGERLQPHIVKQLGLGTANANERCARYLAEDPTVVARRDELMARQKRLESVQRELSNFELRLDY